MYNSIYQNLIKMAPFEFLYGRFYRTTLSWDTLEDKVLFWIKVIQGMEEQMG